MSDENEVLVDGVPQVVADDVMKIEVEDGDALVINLPERANTLPGEQYHAFQQQVSEAFQQIFSDKNVKVIVMPHGMKVEIIKTSLLEDKADDASE